MSSSSYIAMSKRTTKEMAKPILAITMRRKRTSPFSFIWISSGSYVEGEREREREREKRERERNHNRQTHNIGLTQ